MLVPPHPHPNPNPKTLARVPLSPPGANLTATTGTATVPSRLAVLLPVLLSDTLLVRWAWLLFSFERFNDWKDGGKSDQEIYSSFFCSFMRPS